MTAAAGPYAGLDRFEARKRIIAALEQSGELVKTEPYTVNIAKCDRCKTIIEPLVSTQWFVRMKPLAEKAMEAVRERQDPLRSRRSRSRVLPVDGEHPRLVHLAPALVGPSHSRVALPQLPADHSCARNARRVPALPLD